MKITKFSKRLLAILLAMCTVLSLVPTVATPEVKAAEVSIVETISATNEEIASLVSSLTTEYNGLLIPANQKVNVTTSNYTSLDGVYLMLAWNGANTYRAIDVTTRGDRATRITYNTPDSDTSNDNNKGYTYIVRSATVSGNSVTQINSANLTNLNYAFELQANTFNVKRNTTTVEYANKGTASEVKWTGWQGRIGWEYDRTNGWAVVNEKEQKFGPYLKIAWKPTASKPGAAYNIKSLHPSRETKPWLTASKSNENLDFTATRFPFYFIPNSDSTLKNSTKIYKLDPGDGTNAGSSTLTYWLGWDSYPSTQHMTAATVSMVVREDRNVAYKSNPDLYHNKFFMDWVFYRISPYTLELFQALQRVKSVVTGGNTNGKYDADLYLDFLKDVQTAITTYKNNYTTYSTSTTNANRMKFDAMARDLTSKAELLEIETDPNSYADIPIEVLDFRADGLLFEYLSGSAYGLNDASPKTVNGATFPGSLIKGDNDVHFTKGLIEPDLKDGRIVYTEETVTYIAKALAAKHYTFADSSITFSASNFDPYYNKTFMADAVAGLPIGDFNQTKGKTTGKYAGENGGILRYEQVETCFDLAYYMLSNLWQEAPSDDIVETVTKNGKTYNLPYNIRIPELTTIRLIKNSKGEYVFNAALENGRDLDSGLIFNYKSLKANDGKSPALDAAVNLGFESDSMFGINGTGAIENRVYTTKSNANYSVVYHFRSAFVYYKSKGLQFSFTGDDDVYFFINDHLVCDLGGTHSPSSQASQLNGNVAQTLGLQDGDICTFDIYLADRHATGINMNFQTNIEMMPVEAVAEMEQYRYTQAGEIGTELAEGAVIPAKTEVGYGLKLLNRCKHGVTDLTFTDELLGVELTSDSLTLGSSVEANDLVLIYRTYKADSGTLSSATPQDYSYDTLYQALSNAINIFDSTEPMPDGVYRITGLTEAQIMSLLKLGLPAGVQLSIYGFHHTATATYANTLYTSCRPIEGKNSDGSYAYKATLTSSTSRSLNVQEMDAVTAQPLRIALDYGKPVSFTMSQLLSCLTYDPMDATVEYLGVSAKGNHGDITFTAPSYLSLPSNNTFLTTMDGNFELLNDTFRFSPRGIMDRVVRIYATIKVADVYLASNWYLTVGIELVPATVVFYEAEELAESNEMDFVEAQEGVESDEVTIVGDSKENEIVLDSNLPNNEQYDPTNYENVIFFSFENTTADQARYNTNPVYGKTNYDDKSKWTKSSDFSEWSPASSSSYLYKPSGAFNINASHPSSSWLEYITPFKLNYKPGENDWVEVRMRLNNVVANNTNNEIIFCPEFYSDANSNTYVRTRPAVHINTVEAGTDWFVLKFPVVTSSAWPATFSYEDIDTVYAVSLCFELLKPAYNHSISIDYFYVGPEDKSPSSLNSDYLYFGFDNTAADQYRYTNHIYGSRVNFDKAPTTQRDDWIYTATRTTGFEVKDSALIVTSGTIGGSKTNSPYIQTCGVEMGQTIHHYSTDRAEIVQLKLKFSNMTTDCNVRDGNSDYGLDHSVVRLGFILDDDETYEDSACYVDWPVTEAQLNGCDYFVLSAPIAKLLQQHSAKRISAIRLTIINAAGISGKTGTFSLDYLYVGPKQAQSSDIVIDAPQTTPMVHPEADPYTPNYDSKALYFGFDNSSDDRLRYQHNKNYGGKQFDEIGNWWVPSYGTLGSISNGALTFKSKNTKDTWGYVATGAKSSSDPTTASKAQFPLNYKPNVNDWCEIRVKMDSSLTGANLSNSGGSFGLYVECFPNSADATTKVRSKTWFSVDKVNSGYFTLQFSMVASRESSNTSYVYETMPQIRRFNLLFTNIKANNEVTFTIDYVYIGPKDTMPSKISENRLYFGFDNNEAAQFKYNADVYGGTNYDLAANWNYNGDRSPTVGIANGIFSATVTASGADISADPWFDTRNGAVKKHLLNYKPKGSEWIQVRVRFYNLAVIDTDRYGELWLQFYDASNHSDSTTRRAKYEVPSLDLTTDGKWFTYTFFIGDALSGLAKSDCMRINFANIQGVESKGKIEIDYIYVGPQLNAPKETKSLRSNAAAGTTAQYDPYGYDASRNDESTYSDHRTLFTIGQGVKTTLNPTNYTIYSFDFTGTGFDIISRTGPQQGSVRAMIYYDEERTKLATARQVILKGASDLEQVPVLSIELADNQLPHGHYYVDICVAAPYDYGEEGDADQYGGSLDRGGEFYFDGIRIFGTIDTSANTADAASANALYQKHGEADSVVVELRDRLISSDSFSADGEMEGIVYLDEKFLAVNEVDLRMNNASERLIRKQETNLGDFAADALYYYYSSQNAALDGAIVPATDIRENLRLGNIYSADAERVQPQNHLACVQEVTGRQLLDALEWGARKAGDGESEAFLQVSGITYEIHTKLTPNIETCYNGWRASLRPVLNNTSDIYANYRVKNVTVGGKPLDPNATYKIAGYDGIMLEQREGFAMFEGSTTLTSEGADCAHVLMNYIKSFPLVDGIPTVQANNSMLNVNYADPNGTGRIRIVDTAEKIAVNNVVFEYENSDGEILARTQETALGNFAADALYALFDQKGLKVDAAIITASTIRASLPNGELSQADLQAVHPMAYSACLKTLTGQQLLDALEWGARRAGYAPCATFLQVSGITYEIHTAVKANVLEKSSAWNGTPDSTEYRVKNVMIGGKPLDLTANYNIASYSNLFESDGFTMLADAVSVLDHAEYGSNVLEAYAKSFPEVEGVPTISSVSSGRITLVSGDKVQKWPYRERADEVAKFYVDTPEREETASNDVELTPSIQDYSDIGPNNEVYLTNGSAIAFKLEAIAEIPATLNIEARSADGKPVSLLVVFGQTPPMSLPTDSGRAITTSTLQYYSMNITEADWAEEEDGGYYLYVTIANAGANVEGILSITDIRYGYSSAEPATHSGNSRRSLRFVVDETMRGISECAGHSYTYTENGDMHRAYCSKCGEIRQLAHSYEDSVCVCGAIKVQASVIPTVDQALTFSMNISASTQMAVSYNIMASAVSDYREFYLQVEKNGEYGESTVVTYRLDDGINVTLHPITGEALIYNATFAGVSAKEMGDSFSATLYAVAQDGSLYCSNTVTTSVKEYLMARLADADASQELKTMAVDMLYYGAAAQYFFDYEPWFIATDALSDQQLAYATAEIPEATDCFAISGEGATVTASVTVGARVELGLTAIVSGISDPSAVRCEIRDLDGNLLAEPEVTCSAGIVFSANHSDVGAREMRKSITATFYVGDEAVSQTITWSVESYVAQTRANANATADDVAMVNALLTYGDAVANYLTSIGQ